MALQGSIDAGAATSRDAEAGPDGRCGSGHRREGCGLAVESYGHFDYVPDSAFRHDTAAPRDWIQAAFYIGLTAFADASRKPRYVDAILAHGDAEGWGFDQRPRHADADATGAVWVWAAQHTRDPAQTGSDQGALRCRVGRSLDGVTGLRHWQRRSHCQDRWCWSDALFMAPPAWIALSSATGDERYLAHADTEFWATTDFLYDKEEHLYFRDSRFIAQRDAAGRKIFWGRGNGWVFAGLARILSDLPEDIPAVRATRRCSNRWRRSS